ncbi:MAG TPA: cation diffusion facilitator family transporter, partial [Sphingomicrobium sp.]|nr:cation diffusion facilitator family transporter [Sphingomicrobium sp.]
MAHSHGHDHAPANFTRAFFIGIALNSVFIAAEVAAGFFADSVALLADAGHNLSDVLGLALAWAAAAMAARPRSDRFTYGLKKAPILAALFNAIFLLVAIGAILLEGIQRLFHPEPADGRVVMVVAAIGILINGMTAWLFASGRKHDLNIRGAYLHMAADTAVSLGVVVAGALILYTGLQWIDPVVSIIVALVILWGTFDLLKQSTGMSLAGVPHGISLAEVDSSLSAIDGVAALHDLHIWPMSTTE